MRRRTLTTIAATAALATALGTGAAAAGGQQAAIYTLSNEASGNAVIAFSRAQNGSLDELGRYETGGLGSGGGLGSQGSVVLSDDRRLLVAVDAGSDELTSFRVRNDGTLQRRDQIGSGGDMPISATVRDGLVYVVNAGGSGGIAGFRINGGGDLSAIAGSHRPLSTAASGPAEIAFSPNGRVLVVTEKATNRITTYRVDGNGVAHGPTWVGSAGITPFGFEFDGKGRFFVSEASGGATDASTLSVYRAPRGQVSLVDGPAATTETSACWVAVTPNGRFAYTANTGSGTISGFAIAADGSVTRLDADGVTGDDGAGTSPADIDTSRDGRFLFVLDGRVDEVSAYRIGADGSLTPIDGLTGLPASGVGLAAS